MTPKAEPHLRLSDPYVLDRERASREISNPIGNEAAWSEFARWITQNPQPKPQMGAAGFIGGRDAHLESVRTRTKPKPTPQASFQQVNRREDDRILKTNLSNHSVGGGRSSSARVRSLIVWIPVAALIAWFWFGRG